MELGFFKFCTIGIYCIPHSASKLYLIIEGVRCGVFLSSIVYLGASIGVRIIAVYQLNLM
jgi:hypothetical protein